MLDYARLLQEKYPAKQHARRVADRIRKEVPCANGVIYLEGRKAKLMEDCDQEEPFRQRRSFFYLSGCPIPDSYLIYDIDANKLILFIPSINNEEVVWSGLPVSHDEALARFDVDEVKAATVGEVNGTLKDIAAGRTVFYIHGQVSDSTTLIQFDGKNYEALKPAIEKTRVVKDDYECALIYKANKISSAAHRAVLEKVRTAKKEGELEAIFWATCRAKGAKHQAYSSIVASGRSAATLHYVKNDASLQGKLNLLLDAACEMDCYAADITRTFPIDGKFTTESRAIYDIVLKMQKECIAVLKEGVGWEDVHMLAHTIAIDGLVELGILKGDREEIREARTSTKFLPHGLGHFLGMDTHDTGGCPNYSDPDPYFKYLRVRGKLPAGAVITVEPGIYFCKFILDPALQDPVHRKFIDEAVLEKYWDVGGVRIEDNIKITETGSENLTTAVKEVKDMERIIAGT